MATDDDEDYSDLTDISEYEGNGGSSSKKRKGRASSPGGGYRIRGALKPARSTTYTVQALYDQIHSDDIKLDPEYQRDVVWPDSKMVGLIDSILRSFYVPPVIFSVTSYDDGSEKRICIDGKQRLTSIQRFMDGLKLWYTDIGGGGGKLRKKVLPLKYRKLFANKQIVCVEYSDLTDSDEREIFQRVQLGMALTPAEKLQVTNTPRSTFIRSLIAHFLTSSSSSSSTDGAGSLAHFDWDRARGADYRCIAQIVHSLHTFPAFPSPGRKITTTLKGLASIPQLEKFLSEAVPLTPEFENQVRAALRVVGALASDRSMFRKGEERMEVKSVFRTPTKAAPVEIVLVGLLVGVHMAAAGATSAVVPKKETKTEKEQREAREGEGRRRLAEGIYLMRKDVREAHVDIRMNGRVSKTMVDFVRAWHPTDRSSPTSSSGTTTGKRKRSSSANKERASAEDGEVATDEEAPMGNGEEEDGEVHLSRMKFKKVARFPTPPKPPAPSVLPPKPLPIPAAARPDRMAALRAAKMQTIPSVTIPPPVSTANWGAPQSSGWGQVQSTTNGWGKADIG
ncbi:hypothetical protein DXG01_001758 [Tephrocybe rancida]|nr:hypothetical protein DXG01_001758 [Tephrocybe rancida]